MPLDHPINRTTDAALTAKMARLNKGLRHHSATDVLRVAFEEVSDLALVSSFGAESVALLHLSAMVNRDVSVLFIDTEMLFAQTLVYQQEVAERLGLRNLRILRNTDTSKEDPQRRLHETDPDACCALRKTQPLQSALRAHGGWITGRKRFQSGQRAELPFFEVEANTSRIKVNPLAYWQPGDVADYIAENRLPRHPMVAQGYPSIGCAPCTSPVSAGEDPRKGRWRDSDKDECGIHLVNGKMVRIGDPA